MLADSTLTKAPPFLELSARWLLSSGIREPGGGMARYYLAAERRNKPVSTEITGYAASTFAYLAEQTGEVEYHDAATGSARFLVNEAWHDELRAFPFEMSTPGDSGLAPAYFFDCGIIVRGLLAVWRLTTDDGLLEAAVAAGRAMAEDFLTESAIHPVLSLPSKDVLPYDDARWSRKPGCYQLKSAMAWLDLERATGEETFGRYFDRALALALASHDSFLPGSDDIEKVMDRLHAYCYFLEGLLPVADRSEAGAVLESGIRRTASLLGQIAPQFSRSDVYAQLLRLRLYADAAGVLPLDQAAAEEAAAIPLFQREDPDPRINGGFYFGQRDGRLLPFVNPVSTAFCLQALFQWRQYQAGEFQPVTEALI